MNNNNNKRSGPGNRKGSDGKARLQSSKSRPKTTVQARTASRGEAIRALRRNQDDATKTINQYVDTDDRKPRANFIDDGPKLKVIGLGGMDGGGSKNMMLVEYADDAIVIDCGIDLGIDLPGINYAICDVSYLESIKHKLKGYVITHGHLDHIGGLPHIVQKVPAPVFGSRFTIGRVEEIFKNFGLPMPEGFKLETVIMNEHNHEKLKLGVFFVELVGITHSIPGSTLVVVDTPVGRIVNTGDFRLDPNPLDHEKTDTERLIELGKEGVLALFSESTTTERPGRTPSESTIEQSFIDIMQNAPGRMFVALFSTNVNRVQMIVNAAVKHNRKIVLDGRSMMSTLEMAVRNGFMKIPKGTFVPINSVGNLPDKDIVVMCTGSQGEPNSALQRMAYGQHKHVKLKAQDTIVLSSTPIPESGNDRLIGDMVDNLMKMGAHVYRHQTREIDGCGPLHVSGHASIEEYRDMIDMLQPKYFVPIYGSFRSKWRHIEIAVEQGIPRKNTLNVENGDVIMFEKDKMHVPGKVHAGTVLVDQSGAPVSSVVVKDRLIIGEDGLVVVILTMDRKTGRLLTSPDIISRGFIYMRDSEDLMTVFRTELKRAVLQRYKRIDLDRFKAELKDYVSHFLYEQTQRSPVVIPVVNIVNSGGGGGGGGGSRGGKKPDGSGESKDQKDQQPEKTPEQIAKDQQDRFASMRQQLLGQDPRTD